MNIDWSKAPEWANAVIEGTGVLVWVPFTDGICTGQIIEDGRSQEVDMLPPHKWKLVEVRPVKPWTGDGLPPVGIEIEAMMRRNMHDGYAWHRAKVVHGPLPGSEGEVLVFCLETTSPAWVDEFRPVRTPEQIAAEQRKKEIDEIHKICIESFPSSTRTGELNRTISDCACIIYKAGYRKQVEL
ncbi:hypothetical protein PFLL34_03586 [Pseudomonas fluorescens]|uniref:hypothetical protein n=1 Tax=Pseudomonas TaxID=286 RepID=UPI00076BFAFE|nr:MULTISPECIES: hypothetical protein [Pseudomonas]KWV82537.1 hypothetical protein PFLL34_03586 [Pseudomonas fluorescens]MBW9238325.1 hypothetical protein [Pseudomonas carnis]